MSRDVTFRVDVNMSFDVPVVLRDPHHYEEHKVRAVLKLARALERLGAYGLEVEGCMFKDFDRDATPFTDALGTRP